MNISKKRLHEIIEKAYFEVLEEASLPDSSQMILGKFPTLKKVLAGLMTPDYENFTDEVQWVSPKPSTFKITLKNGSFFFLKWLGTGFQAEIRGKRYYLTNVSEYQQALDSLGELLKYKPIASIDTPEELPPAGGPEGFGEEPSGFADKIEDEPTDDEEEADTTEFS